MYVCLCRAVSNTTIDAAIRDGARTVDEVGGACGAGTECGKCRTTIEFMLSRDRDALVGGRLQGSGE